MPSGLIWKRHFVHTKQRGAIWIMVGRPRKIGKRQPNGQLARAYVSPKAQVSAQPHRMGVLLKYREWPEAESEFGRLMLNDKITPAQYEAGRLYSSLADSYRAVWDIPRLHPCAVDLMNVGPSVSQGMASEQARAIKDRYDKAFEACGVAGHRAQRAVKDYAVFERKVPDPDALKLLKDGLNSLVSHFKIHPGLTIDRRARIIDSRN